MKNQTLSTATMIAGVVVGWMWLTALQCGGEGGGPTSPPPKVQNCEITYHPDTTAFRDSRVFLNEPANCPILLQGFEYVEFSATAELSRLYFRNPRDFFYMIARDRLGEIVQINYTPTFGDGSGIYVVYTSGTYAAATEGFDSNDRGYDDVYDVFQAANNRDTVFAVARITYERGWPANRLSGPTSSPPYASYGVSAVPTDWRLVGPITWHWYVDGNYVGTSSGDSYTSFVVPGGGTPGTWQGVTAWAQDANGYWQSGSTNVWICPGPEDDCSP
jgi:hypothetical protein